MCECTILSSDACATLTIHYFLTFHPEKQRKRRVHVHVHGLALVFYIFSRCRMKKVSENLSVSAVSQLFLMKKEIHAFQNKKDVHQLFSSSPPQINSGTFCVCQIQQE
jgi:hypothetical protein